MIRNGQLLRLKRISKSDTVVASHTDEAYLIFTTLSPILEHIVDSQYYLTSSLGSYGTTSEITMSSVSITVAKSKKALTFMKFMALLTHAYLDSILAKHTSPIRTNSGARAVLPEVTRITETLQDSLLSLCLNTDTIMVQRTIVNLCEVYWTANFVDRQVVTTQLIPFFFMKSLSLLSSAASRKVHIPLKSDSLALQIDETSDRQTLKAMEATKADLKRIWTFREALYCFDYESMTKKTDATTDNDEDNAEEKSSYQTMDLLIVRTVSSPLYCKTMEGRKIMAFCFTLHESITMKLHLAIKGQIPNLRGTTVTDKTSLEYYGDIYVRAWRSSHPDLQQDDEMDIPKKKVHENKDSSRSSSQDLSTIHAFIEEEILADLVFTSLHVASPVIAKDLRLLLEPFFTAKKDKHIANLLYRLYGPILWRSLSAANPNVRLLATTVLQKTFPLEDSIELMSRKVVKSNKQEVMNKTVTALEQLLNDAYPRIRVAAADATVRILGEFWDALPPRHIRSLLQIIITKHANDASSSLVRANALHVVTLLLESSDASHAVLRQLLPSLGNLIHDKVERVRVKAVHLLSTIKTIKDIKYYHVVPPKHINCQLAVDGKTVSRAVTKLLINSYFPKDAKGSVQMERTLMFLSSNFEAARVFYANLKYCYPNNIICKLIAMLLKVLKLSVSRHRDMMADGEEDPSSSHYQTVENTEESEDNAEADEELNDSSRVSTAHQIVATNTTLMARVAEIFEILYNSMDTLSSSCESYLQSAVLDIDLESLVNHFVTMSMKYAQLKDRTRETSNSKRIIISILRFCRKISNDQVIKISTQELSNVLNCPWAAHDPTIATTEALHFIYLLCLCGKLGQVVKLLSYSIKNAVLEFSQVSCVKEARVEGSTDMRAPLSICSTSAFPHPSVGVISVGSSKSNGSMHFATTDGREKNHDDSQECMNSDATFLIGLKTEMRSDIALNILSKILKGSDQESRVTREMMLNCKESCELLDEAFESLYHGDPSTSFEVSHLISPHDVLPLSFFL